MSSTLSENETAVATEPSVPWFAAPPVHDIALELPEWYREHQKTSWQSFLQLQDPDRRDENWRFSDLRKVRFSELIAARPAENVDSLEHRAKAEGVEHFAAHFVVSTHRLIFQDFAHLP